MNKKDITDIIGSVGVTFVAMTIPMAIACAVTTIYEFKILSNITLALTIMMPIIGASLITWANKRDK